MPEVILHLAILLLAFLYSSVGHAGASGYIAAMTLAGVAIEEIRPAALMLNLGVACFVVWNFMRGGHFRWHLTWPFLPLAMPCAWLGARIELPTNVISILLGAVLLFSAVRFLMPPADESNECKPPADECTECKRPEIWKSLPVGAVLGFLAGMTGTGGGIFLTPLLLCLGWARPKTAAAASIVFIAGNSLFGLIAFGAQQGGLPWSLMSLLPLAVVGGFVGSRLGSFHFAPATIRRLLSVVLIMAASKLLYGGIAS